MAAAGHLVLPASDYYLAALLAGIDPFQELARFAANRDFATCAIVELEVCRSLRDRETERRCRAHFACMVQQRLDQAIIEQALQLSRLASGLPIPSLIVAACALQLDATVITREACYRSIPSLSVIGSLE